MEANKNKKKEQTTQVNKKERIPVKKVYWKKGDYKELVENPFNL